MNRTPLDLKTLEKRPERFTPEESANLQPEPHTVLVEEGARPRRIGLDLLTKLPHEHAKILRILGERRPRSSVRSRRWVTTLPACLMRNVRGRYRRGATPRRYSVTGRNSV